MFLSGREHLCGLLPHSGAMCLIDDIVEWNEGGIVCRTLSHREAANPLRFQNRLPAVCLLEYVGQATYLHGALVVTKYRPPGGSLERPPLAFIAALRGMTLAVDRLDDIAAPLHIHVKSQAYTRDASSYSFIIEAEERELAAGRLTSKILWEGVPA